MYSSSPLIALVGPTAVGKTALSLKLAEELGAEIISVDSMQVYKYMDIGTAKPNVEEQGRVPHHLIDIACPDEDYNAGRFVKDAENAIEAIRGRGRVPMLVGGTGLYLKSLLEGIFELPAIDRKIRSDVRRRLVKFGSEALHSRLTDIDPVMAAKLHPHDSQRITRGIEIFESTGIRWSDLLRQKEKKFPIKNCYIVGLTRQRSVLYQRIDLRSALMLEKGLIEEVQKLLDMGYSANLKSMQAIGYRHVIEMREGKRGFDATVALLARDTRRYAKRQYTWFSGMQGLQGFDCENEAAIRAGLLAYLENGHAGSPSEQGTQQ
ncbi:MAG: tRNA (adenosine(37)-N6)-dimethylallyltransferase MiaA [Deltaproteobacteria bacterium]